ncbi:MAG: helix-turn-helix transcriptional regulator [Clostridia bacterium]|nr:helix-turn-helix transcriptional regulator [Clostridia bacterium]
MKRAGNEEIYYVNQTGGIRDLLRIQMCGITYPDKNYEISRKNSDVACLEYIEKGMGVLRIDGQTFYPEEGDTYLLQVGTTHHYFSDKETPWKKIFINVSGSLPDSLIEGYGLKNIYYFKGLDLSNELQMILALAKENKEDSTEEIICILNRAFLKMREHIKSIDHPFDIAEKMREYLRNHAASKFKMEELCRYISRSESQSIKIFKKAYGITPYAYFLEKKIKLAKDMLINTNLSVKQIADHLNFADEYYFSNIFKQKTGLSPAKYRKGLSDF